jgi:hypothetical protein
VQDDDTNYHMELIAGLANMRARNYGIPEVRYAALRCTGGSSARERARVRMARI